MLGDFPDPALPERYRFDESRPCGANGAKALETAQTALMAMGFALDESSAGSVELRGPGWRSTQQPSERAASRLRLEVTGQTLRLRAELLGLRSLDRFVAWFPPLLLLGILGIQAIVWAGLGRFGQVAPIFGAVGGGLLLVFVPLAVVLRGVLQRSARAAMDRLVQSCVVASNAP